jgi:Gluconate 2-dehydrogenase subunit 3
LGLGALHDLSNQLYGRDFLKLAESEQFELLRNIAKAEPASSVHRFFELTRTEAIRGYYSSAEGLKELDYRGNAYYAECPGCETAH